MMTDPWYRKVLVAVADDYVRLAGDQLSDDAARQRRISRHGRDNARYALKHLLAVTEGSYDKVPISKGACY